MVKRVFPYQNHLQMCNRAIRKDTAHIHFPFSIIHFQLLSRRRKNHPRKSRVVFYLSHCSVSSHERGQLLNPLQRERRERHRLHGDGHQLHRVIVSRCAVGMQHATVGSTVARLIVHMQARQAVRTVIPVVAARACRYDRTAAHPAGEAVVTGMRFVITLLILLAFILPIHGNSS